MQSMINKNKIGNFLGVIALMLLCAFLGAQIQKKYFDTKEVVKYVKTIEKHVDTLYIERKVIEKEVVYKEKYKYKLKEKESLIKYDTICNEIVDNLKKQLDNCDSIVGLKDKIIFKTDSIVIYKDKIIDKLVVPKVKPFGIGLQVGYDPINNKATYGVGISYNFLNF